MKSHIFYFLSSSSQSNSFNHFVLYHDSHSGLMTYVTSGRPTKEESHKRLNCPKQVLLDIQSIRKELSVEEGSRLLLLVSLATDEMVRFVSMHPETMFGDVTGSTNKQKKDLYMMAVRNPISRTFPGNLTIIPSGKRWVFMCIYKLAFIGLYGKITCSRICLYLTDEDRSEMEPMENLIATDKVFSKTKNRLCIFHGVWQPFKEHIFPKLPKKSKNSKKLTEVGENWGEFLHLLFTSPTFTSYIICPNMIVLFLQLIFLGNYIYTTFSRQCCEHHTKVEYDRSHDLLTETLSTNECKKALNTECILAVEKLQMTLRNKERYLARHMRKGISMSMQAKTTSPEN
mgnify:FL=1